MRRHLARDADSACFSVPHRIERLTGTHVRDVYDAARQLGERDIAQRHDRLGLAGNSPETEPRGMKSFVRHPVGLQRLLLAVLDHRHAEHERVFERAAHQQRCRHRVAVVGDRHASSLSQLGDVGQLLALLATRHRADRVHAGQVRRRRLFQDVLGDAGVVVHRGGIRHARHGREPAGHRRRRPGRHRLLVLLPRLPQVHVHVD
jgi:hypothetical protein